MISVRRHEFAVSGGHISALEFGEGPPKLLLVHATGFNAGTYTQLLTKLGIPAIAIDTRGHGLTDLPADPAQLKSWHIFRDDICAFIDQYIQHPLKIAGHSSGGTIAMMVAAQRPKIVTGYMGLDPVTMPQSMSYLANFAWFRRRMGQSFSLARNALRRRASFESFDYVYNRYKGRGSFKNVDDLIVHDYLKGGLRVDEMSGEVHLTCTPQWEHAVFCAQANNIYKAAKMVRRNGTPARLLYVRKHPASTPGTRLRMRKILGAKAVEFHKDLGHFFPFEEMEYTRQRLMAFLTH